MFWRSYNWNISLYKILQEHQEKLQLEWLKIESTKTCGWITKGIHKEISEDVHVRNTNGIAEKNPEFLEANLEKFKNESLMDFLKELLEEFLKGTLEGNY